ncbi:hypothetical protein [Streptomyces achromogenes]|uniref:hypothetical protein n=1 Tax=Streptomyces achromogenes TaxID=67255 RepID=UPI0004C6AD62|nr:hypothetical protein [Streptomyces achromogenes]
MRVRFLMEKAEQAGAKQGVAALRDGTEYIVLEVFFSGGGDSFFRIDFTQGEDSALFNSEAFVVTSPRIPENWMMFPSGGRSFTLCPESWSRPGFWESYYDHDPQALALYEEERRAIMESS